MEKNAQIHLTVARNQDEDITDIRWQATDAPEPGPQEAKAMLLALWDAEAKNALRIDLWTSDMTVDDMNDFFFQTLLSMADTYKHATGNKELMAEIKIFAREFADKASKIAARAQQAPMP